MLHKTTGISLREIGKERGIKNLSPILLWKRTYEKEGVAGLQSKRGKSKLKDLPKIRRNLLRSDVKKRKIYALKN